MVLQVRDSFLFTKANYIKEPQYYFVNLILLLFYLLLHNPNPTLNCELSGGNISSRAWSACSAESRASYIAGPTDIVYSCCCHYKCPWATCTTACVYPLVKFESVCLSACLSLRPSVRPSPHDDVWRRNSLVLKPTNPESRQTSSRNSPPKIYNDHPSVQRRPTDRPTDRLWATLPSPAIQHPPV